MAGCDQERNFTTKSDGDMGRGHARSAGRSSSYAGPRAGVGFFGRGSKKGVARSEPPPSPIHVTYRNLGDRRKLPLWDPEIDFCALLDLEMVTDGDNSDLKFSNYTSKSGGDRSPPSHTKLRLWAWSQL